MYTQCRYSMNRIKTFKDREAEKIFHQIISAKYPYPIQKIALRKLIMMDDSQTLNDLRVPPANHLEALSGDRKGQYSIRINDQYRICFRCVDNYSFDVEITDYH
ncbi:MAG: type II toxin-antitoxin system RelE/ParE family toxin [Firmicutes bacterium]|nr:type II toxin-antitoxin system RelE/ParE family toxin [Bacillota bacterium]